MFVGFYDFYRLGLHDEIRVALAKHVELATADWKLYLPLLCYY